MTAGREGREINERDESYEQPQTESRVPVVYETFVLIVLRLKNPTPKRFFREHRGTHSKNDKQTGTDRARHRDRKETQQNILCGPAGGKVFGVRKERYKGKKEGYDWLSRAGLGE